MKPLFILTFVVALSLPICGQTKLREIDLRVSGVGSGTPDSVVAKTFGRPLRIKRENTNANLSCSGEAETYVTRFYPGLEIELIGYGKARQLHVTSIEVTSPKWIASGIRVGASKTDVMSKFGKPYSKEERSCELIFYYVTKGNTGGVNFYLRGNRLVKISMNETLC
jgi:hypothetical protein